MFHIKTLPFLFAATGCLVAASNIYDTILPRVSPTIETYDYYKCTTWDLEAFFQPPEPTGELSAAMLKFAFSLRQNCSKTSTNEYLQTVCTFPEHSGFCSFASVAPATLLDGYSSYGSSASSWWAERSDAAVKTADLCRNEWYEAMTAVVYGSVYLNETIAHAACYVEAQVSASATRGTSSAPTPAATNGQIASSTSSVPTGTTQPNDAKRQVIDGGTLLAIGLGAMLATAAML
jgi:hypothetical protein